MGDLFHLANNVSSNFSTIVQSVTPNTNQALSPVLVRRDDFVANERREISSRLLPQVQQAQQQVRQVELQSEQAELLVQQTQGQLQQSQVQAQQAQTQAQQAQLLVQQAEQVRDSEISNLTRPATSGMDRAAAQTRLDQLRRRFESTERFLLISNNGQVLTISSLQNVLDQINNTSHVSEVQRAQFRTEFIDRIDEGVVRQELLNGNTANINGINRELRNARSSYFQGGVVCSLEVQLEETQTERRRLTENNNTRMSELESSLTRLPELIQQAQRQEQERQRQAQQRVQDAQERAQQAQQLAQEAQRRVQELQQQVQEVQQRVREVQEQVQGARQLVHEAEQLALQEEQAQQILSRQQVETSSANFGGRFLITEWHTEDIFTRIRNLISFFLGIHRSPALEQEQIQVQQEQSQVRQEQTQQLSKRLAQQSQWLTQQSQRLTQQLQQRVQQSQQLTQQAQQLFRQSEQQAQLALYVPSREPNLSLGQTASLSSGFQVSFAANVYTQQTITICNYTERGLRLTQKGLAIAGETTVNVMTAGQAPELAALVGGGIRQLSSVSEYAGQRMYGSLGAEQATQVLRQQTIDNVVQTASNVATARVGGQVTRFIGGGPTSSATRRVVANLLGNTVQNTTQNIAQQGGTQILTGEPVSVDLGSALRNGTVSALSSTGGDLARAGTSRVLSGRHDEASATGLTRFIAGRVGSGTSAGITYAADQIISATNNDMAPTPAG